jgi:predicted nucleic acid-binding protein
MCMLPRSSSANISSCFLVSIHAVVAQWMTTELASEPLNAILMLDIRSVAPTSFLHERAPGWAERLGQSKTYDVYYLALAEQEGAELWTADRRLANGAQQAGAAWVHWIGES